MQNMQQHQREQPDRPVARGPKAASDERNDTGAPLAKSGDKASRDGLEHPLIPAKRLNGSLVFNQAGEEIGKVEDIAVDKRSGKVAYAILSFGGFLGLGQKHQPLPWSALTFDPDRGGYVVDVTEEFLRLAPKLDPSDLSGWDDSEQRDAIHTYYAPLGARPYW